MGLLFSQPESVKLLTKKDPSIVKDDAQYPDGFEAAWDDYCATRDENHLVFSGEPIRFVFKTVLGFKEAKRLQNEQMKIQGGQSVVQIGYLFDEFRLSLTDIENPTEDCVFKKDSDGYIKEDTVAKLHAAGILVELWGLLQTAKTAPAVDLTKKNSPL